MSDSHHSSRHFVVGIIILVLGLILLLDQLGFSEANKLWPLILIYFGVTKFRSSTDIVGRFWSGFLALLGISLELEELGIGHINIATIWPVLLICIGVLLVLRHYEARRWMESNSQRYSPPPPAPQTPGVPAAEPPPSGPTPSATSAPPEPGAPAAPGPAAGPQPSPAGSQAQTPPPPPPFPPPPPPPGSANFYNSAWDPESWRSQRAWQRFQRRMDRMNARMNSKWGPGANWQSSSNWQANPNWQAKSSAAGGPGWYESTEPHLNDVNVFWGTRRRIISKNFVGGEVVAIFGGFEIDLTQADIMGYEAKLDIVALFGGGEVRVPPNWNVILKTIGIFGGASDRTLHPAQTNAAAFASGAQSGPPVKTLIIDGVSLFGGVTIKN